MNPEIVIPTIPIQPQSPLLALTPILKFSMDIEDQPNTKRRKRDTENPSHVPSAGIISAPLSHASVTIAASSAQAADSSSTVAVSSKNVRFKCPQENCSKSYEVKESLTRHIKTAHQGPHQERRLNCEGGNRKCKETFKNMANLGKHKKFHSAYHEAPPGTQDPTLVCHECELLYRNKGRCSEHKNKYHHESPHIAIASTTVSEENTEFIPSLLILNIHLI